MGLPALRDTAAGIWCGRENIPVNDDDLRESIGERARSEESCDARADHYGLAATCRLAAQ